ncbi:hypothetical protein [Massilia genomosp. 1]|uniref:hypothetical protein n=1 Tax=Massilia genomosp. 1 TaxID=2609280 RepID=UPI001C9E9475|nr:hypothetical protein [Massilia genomosp. 1]
MSTPKRLHLILPMAGLLMLAACGGGDSAPPTPTPTPTPPDITGINMTPFIERAGQCVR